MLNNSGPSTEPYGTPLKTENQLEEKTFKTTLCLRHIKKFLNQVNTLPVIPYASNFTSNLL